jgi:NADH-quinone oxidoreductase subunit L
MLIGCLAIAGVSVPFIVGFSGYYSKDAILEQALAFWQTNQLPLAGVFFVLAIVGAAMTTTYMFRMWFMTFVGQPRDEHAYEHAHESPPVMYLPLVVLAVLAVSVAWNYQYIGYFAVAAAFFIGRGWQKGWFTSLRSQLGHAGHSHADHSHADHGHGPAAHGHPGHTHHADTHQVPDDAHLSQSEAHAGGLPSHSPGGHHEAPHHGPVSLAERGLTWSWLALMVATTVVIGYLIHQGIGETSRNGFSLRAMLDQARPEGTLLDMHGKSPAWTWPNEHKAHLPENFSSIVVPATLLATASWAGGILIAGAFFWWGTLRPDDVRRQFAPVYNALVNKWWFDELYDAIFVQPTFVVSRMIAAIDRRWIDGFLDRLAAACVWFARLWDLVADRSLVDGFVNLIARWTYSLGLSLRSIQTGSIRQYVMFIVIGAVAVFILISFFWSPTLAR